MFLSNKKEEINNFKVKINRNNLSKYNQTQFSNILDNRSKFNTNPRVLGIEENPFFNPKTNSDEIQNIKIEPIGIINTKNIKNTNKF